MTDQAYSLRGLSLEEILSRLLSLTENGTQSEVAERLGVSKAYVSYVFCGVKPPSRKMLSAIGVERRTFYAEVAR